MPENRPGSCGMLLGRQYIRPVAVRSTINGNNDVRFQFDPVQLRDVMQS